MPYQKGQRLRLKRNFWGHKPGTKGRVTSTHAPISPYDYTAKMRLKGSPTVHLNDKDMGDLVDPEPELQRESMNDQKISENKWQSKAVNPKHKGYCTPMSKKTCTPRRKAFARRHKAGGDLYHESRDLIENRLTYQARKKLPPKDFVYPGKRAYPIEDPAHARNALSRVSTFGSPSEKKKVRAAVHSKYPEIGHAHESAKRLVATMLEDESYFAPGGNTGIDPDSTRDEIRRIMHERDVDYQTARDMALNGGTQTESVQKLVLPAGL